MPGIRDHWCDPGSVIGVKTGQTGQVEAGISFRGCIGLYPCPKIAFMLVVEIPGEINSRSGTVQCGCIDVWGGAAFQTHDQVTAFSTGFFSLFSGTPFLPHDLQDQ